MSPSRRTVIAGVMLMPLSLKAQPVPTRPDYAVLRDPPSTHSLSRVDISTGDRTYRVFRAVPRGTPPATGWPSIWMLDGNAAFDRIAPAHLIAHPGLAIFGIGYPIDRLFDGAARSLDYTPHSAGPRADPRHPDRETGGDSAFRARLTGPLLRQAGDGLRLDPRRRALWGHSYGGLFTLATLFTTPDAFSTWIPVSPSTGFGDGALSRLAETDARPGRERVRFFLGDREHRRGTPAPPDPRPDPRTVALARRLAGRPGLDVDLTVLSGLGHGATFAASFPAAFAAAAR